ncbi:MAG: hypothetical protein RIE16_01320, partial [Rhodospirillales bacterium]
LAGPTEGSGGRVETAARATREANTGPGEDATGSVRARTSAEVVVPSRQKPVESGTQAQAKTGEAAQLSSMLESMADAPACDVCGTITVRNGTCYKCLNCGNSMGCS